MILNSKLLVSISLLVVVCCSHQASLHPQPAPFNCNYDIDMYNCVNINCKGQKKLNKIPSSLSQLISVAKLKSTQLLCSIDLSDTGLQIVDKHTMENINLIYDELISYNLGHANNVIKVSLSNIKQIESFTLTNTNIVLFIRDSLINEAVEPKSLRSSSHKIDLNLINVTLNANGWLNLLDSTSFHNLFTIFVCLNHCCKNENQNQNLNKIINSKKF